MSSRLLSRSSTAAALLLTLLCALALASGVSQQWFEWAHAPDVYARALLRDGQWLRAIIAIDDVFIAAYVTSSVVLARALARGKPTSLHVLITVGGALAGVLDLEENHHLLAMLRLAERDVAIPLEEIIRRSDLSQLKWMLGHLAFVLVGVCIVPKDGFTRFFRTSLIAWQLPLGALTWAVEAQPFGTILTWMRYLAFVSGFALVAWFSRRGADERAFDVADSGAPA